MSVIWLVLFAVGLAGPVWLIHYLHRLPYAPACPHCSGVTEEGAPAAALDRFWAALADVGLRRCERCGWSGRMRWRLAPEPSRRGGGTR